MVKPDFVIGSWLVLLLSEQFMVLASSKEELYLRRRCPCSKRYPIPTPVFVFSGTRSS